MAEDKRIYLVQKEQGEWSDYGSSIIGAFDNLEQAQELRDKRIKEQEDYRKTCRLAIKLLNEDITEEEAGMTYEEAEQEYSSWDDEPRYSIFSLSLNQEDIERNEG